MIYKSPSDYYQLVHPGNWKIEENENTITIYDTLNGIGAINITSYMIPIDYEFFVEKELVEFVDNDEIIHNNIKVTQVDQTNIAFLEFVIDNRYWQYYTLFCNHKALFITYNCNVVEKNKELSLVKQIINSILIN